MFRSKFSVFFLRIGTDYVCQVFREKL